MIITDKFVFIHMHKTGGQTVNRILSRLFPDSEVVGYHYPVSLVPASNTNLPIIGFIRNPWDWYVSWYAFNRRPKARNALFSVCSDGGKADFATTVSNLVTLGENTKAAGNYRNALESVLPESLIGNRGVGLTKSCIRNFVDDDTGYCTWMFERMFGTDYERARIGRYEYLQEDLVGILEEIDVPETANVARAMSRAPRLNMSRHSHYSHYYSNELANLVATKDARIIEKFGYSFDKNQPGGNIVNLPSTGTIDNHFRKLKGIEKNFLQLPGTTNVRPIVSRLAELPDSAWKKSAREKRHKAHNQTEAVLLIHDADMRHRDPTVHEQHANFEKLLAPTMSSIAEFYGGDGYFIRALFARLRAKSAILPHIDLTFSLLHCHRVHIPIVTNDGVVFTIGGEAKNLRPGEIWEINNATVHGVDNDGEDARVHLIVDWVPNSIRRTLERLHEETNQRSSTPRQGPQRDSLCSCGSGLKFRNCHGVFPNLN